MRRELFYGILEPSIWGNLESIYASPSQISVLAKVSWKKRQCLYSWRRLEHLVFPVNRASYFSSCVDYEVDQQVSPTWSCFYLYFMPDWVLKEVWLFSKFRSVSTELLHLNFKAQPHMHQYWKISLHILKGTSSLEGIIFQYSWNCNICLFLFSSSVAMHYRMENLVG